MGTRAKSSGAVSSSDEAYSEIVLPAMPADKAGATSPAWPQVDDCWSQEASSQRAAQAPTAFLESSRRDRPRAAHVDDDVVAVGPAVDRWFSIQATVTGEPMRGGHAAVVRGWSSELGRPAVRSAAHRVQLGRRVDRRVPVS